MKNLLKKYVEIQVILALCVLGFLYYAANFIYVKYKNSHLSQEVSVLDGMDKMRCAYDYSTSHNDESFGKNPFYTDKTVYVLETCYGNITNFNYGSEAEILAIKCKVAKETIDEYNLSQKLEIEAEKAEIIQDSLNELALERLNEKTCN